MTIASDLAANDDLSPLISRQARRIIASFHSDVQPVTIGKTELEWHRRHQDSHIRREALLILSGKMVQSLNGHYYQATPNSLFLFDRHERHAKGYYPSTQGRHLWVFFAPDVLVCNLTLCRQGGFRFSHRYFCKNQALIRRLENAWDDSAAQACWQLSLAELNALFSIVFAECYRAFSDPEQGGKSEYQMPHLQEIIQMIKGYLRDNCGRNCSIDTLARLAGCSRSHFLRLFRSHTGMRVKEYVDMIRREKYEQLKGVATVKSIAWELGFASSAALLHWKKNKLHPPSAAAAPSAKAD
jgi:AraC-like DNA-binding protein